MRHHDGETGARDDACECEDVALAERKNVALKTGWTDNRPVRHEGAQPERPIVSAVKPSQRGSHHARHAHVPSILDQAPAFFSRVLDSAEMELRVRSGADRFAPSGAYRALEFQLRRRSAELAEMPAVVVSAFDRRTRLFPHMFLSPRLFPPGAAAVAAALYQAGFLRTRAVYQLWNPNFRPSAAKWDGRTPQMLLVSSLSLYSRNAYGLIQDARSGGADRPLIIVGGPKAIYEPYDFWLTADGRARPAPDVAVTGEAYVLLELLNVLLSYRTRGESMRVAFERAAREGALASIPGLVYRDPFSSPDQPRLVDTGLQRLVRDYDELPSPAIGLGLLEPPHRGSGLRDRALIDAEVGRHVMFVSVQATQGCRFTCSYCPIPAVNQKSWRYRSAEGLARDVATIYERFGINHFAFADDNFFNDRNTVQELLTGMARAKANGRPFGEAIRFITEATQIDTYRNRDLLPLAREAGLHSLWFGVEDLTASLVKKGQGFEKTLELFRLMHQLKICPIAMMMYHEGQPFYTRDSMYGLVNQINFLRKAGAIGVQCTVHFPAIGTREFEAAFASGGVIKSVGAYQISDADFDGNHVVVVGREAPWKRQLKLIGGYAAFYNPLNLVRAFKRDGAPLRQRRIEFQALGHLGVLWSGIRLAPYAIRLLTAKLHCHAGPLAVEPLPILKPAEAFPRLPVEPADAASRVPATI